MLDWQDASAYPYPVDTSSYQWAWEFLRRNPEYREDYIAGKFQEGLPHDDLAKMARKYGLHHNCAFPDPTLNEPVTTIKDFRGHERENLLVFASMVRTLPMRTPMKECGTNEIFVKIDLSLPIEMQLSDAKEWLLFLRTEMDIKQRRSSSTKFPFYLRVLDAREQGVTYTQIAGVLYPHIENVYPGFRGSHKIKDIMRAAMRLRDYGYQFLCTGSMEK